MLKYIDTFFKDYRRDPYSEYSPIDAICARFDLSSSPRTAGCYDTKVRLLYFFVWFLDMPLQKEKQKVVYVTISYSVS